MTAIVLERPGAHLEVRRQGKGKGDREWIGRRERESEGRRSGDREERFDNPQVQDMKAATMSDERQAGRKRGGEGNRPNALVTYTLRIYTVT